MSRTDATDSYMLHCWFSVDRYPWHHHGSQACDLPTDLRTHLAGGTRCVWRTRRRWDGCPGCEWCDGLKYRRERRRHDRHQARARIRDGRALEQD